MVESTKVLGKITTCMEKEHTHGKMEEDMMVIRIFICILYESKNLLGEYNMDKKHGYGVYIWADSRRYEGLWHNGKQHGKGKYILPNSTVKVGIW